MEKLKSKNAKELVKSMINTLLPYKNNIKTITSDNGTGFTEHEYISQKLECDFYFAHPYSSWERGLNENMKLMLFPINNTNYTCKIV